MSLSNNNDKTSQLHKNNPLNELENTSNSKELLLLSSESSDEEYLPLAAKDSEWAGFKFYDTNIKNLKGATDITTFNKFEALVALFPDLNNNENFKLCKSTTDITKFLVGKKANFEAMNNENQISKSVSEIIDNKMATSDTDFYNAGNVSQNKNSFGDIDSPYENYDVDEEEPKRNTHVKRRKKRSDGKLMPAVVSSASLILKIHHKPSSKLKSTKGKSVVSVHSSFADDEGINSGKLEKK